MDKCCALVIRLDSADCDIGPGLSRPFESVEPQGSGRGGEGADGNHNDKGCIEGSAHGGTSISVILSRTSAGPAIIRRRRSQS